MVTSNLLLAGLLSIQPTAAAAAAAPVGLGTAGTYSVLGGAAVTNTGPTTLSGDLGVSPGTAISGFPPGTVGGSTHASDAQAAQAQSDLTTGYNSAAGRAPTASVTGDLVGQTLNAGVYKSIGPLAISGTLTLDGQGDPGGVFIFQIASTLITASSSRIKAINGAQACNVFWQVGSSATLGTTSSFLGTLMALMSITVTTNTTVKGRALARNGAVTLDNNTFTNPACLSTQPAILTTTSLTASSNPATAGQPVRLTAAVRGTKGVPTGTVTFFEGGKSLGTVRLTATGRATLSIPAGTVPRTRKITARYNGHPGFLASTSTILRLQVEAASAKSPVGSPSGNGNALPATGPAYLARLASSGTTLVALGLALAWTARRRRKTELGGVS